MTQKDEQMTSSGFKVVLRNFEENKKCQQVENKTRSKDHNMWAQPEDNNMKGNSTCFSRWKHKAIILSSVKGEK